MSKFMIAIVLAALGVTGFTGCGEREQNASYKDGKYRGKPDGRPWESQPPAYVPGGWAKGDRIEWEKQMRARSAGQNEYQRIGH